MQNIATQNHHRKTILRLNMTYVLNMILRRIEGMVFSPTPFQAIASEKRLI